MTIDKLDNVLKMLYESPREYILDGRIQNDKLWNLDYNDRVSILNKLVSEGFVIEKEREIFDEPILTYIISFDGKLFYETASIKGRPFHSRDIRNKWKNRYEIFKTIAICVNALAIIFISWLSYKSQDKEILVDKRQSIIDSLSRITEIQKLEIERYKQIQSDTTSK